jgi:uncharacterized DUF497 family protein
MKARFRWDEWNRAHIAKHGVSETEAQYIVQHARPPYPELLADEKSLIWGQTEAGRYLQVIYLIDRDENLDYESMTLEDILLMADDDAPPFYVIHARDLSSREKKLYRRTK